MKVPKMYKSSDRYNAGTDVIYDDDTKLQYAPFIYATTESGDNGADDGGEDEEGEDIMVVNVISGSLDDPTTLDKTWTEIHDAIVAGKTVMVVHSSILGISVGYVVGVSSVEHNGTQYVVDVITETSNAVPIVETFKADASDDVLILVTGDSPIE